MFKAFRNLCELNGTKGRGAEKSQLLILQKWKSLQNSGDKASVNKTDEAIQTSGFAF